MIIQKLKLTNIKGVKKIDIHCDEDVVQLCGKNGSGKTTTLDSIRWAFGGKKEIEDEPIRTGEEEGEIFLETDDIVITRKFKKDGKKTTLKVEGKKGGKYNQGDLNKIFDTITINPMEFYKLDAKDQINQLERLMGDEFREKLAKCREEYQEAYEERSSINRQIKNMGEIKIPEKLDEVPISELLKRRKELEEYNNEQDELNEKHEWCDEKLGELTEKLQMLQEKIDKVRSNIAKVEEKRKSLDKPKVLKTKELEEVMEQIERAEKANSNAAEYHIAKAKLEEKKKLEEKHEELNEKVKQLKGAEAELIDNSDLPIKGLTFQDGEIWVKDRPFKQLSEGEKVKVSAMIAMSFNPDLRVMLVKGGSDLDEDNFKTLLKLAKKRKFQLWVERITPVGECIMLEDGEKKKKKKAKE